MAHRTEKRRLYPGKECEQRLEEALEASRRAWNFGIEWWREEGLKWQGAAKRLRVVRHEDVRLQWLCSDTLSKLMMAQAGARKAVETKRRQGQLGNGKGKLHFVKYGEHDWVPFRARGRIRLEKKEGTKTKLWLPNIGLVPVRMHRELPAGAVVKAFVVKRLNRRWWVNIQLEMPDQTKNRDGLPDVGIDLGLTHLLALSDGTIFDAPQWYRVSQELREEKAQRATKGKDLQRAPVSNRMRKRYALQARHEEHVANQRRHWWHETTTMLDRNFDHVCVEDLSPKFMIEGDKSRLAKSATDAAWATGVQMLEYKLKDRLVKVDPAGTSQECSACGAVVPKDISVRVHYCDKCGLTLDRDVNAARNILTRGQAQLTATQGG